MTVLAIIALLVLFARWLVDDVRGDDFIKGLAVIAGTIAVLVFAFAPSVFQ